VITFTIKKIIYTELLINRTAPLYLEETCVRVVTNEGDQQICTSQLEGASTTLNRNAWLKGVE